VSKGFPLLVDKELRSFLFILSPPTKMTMISTFPSFPFKNQRIITNSIFPRQFRNIYIKSLVTLEMTKDEKMGMDSLVTHMSIYILYTHF